jgi:hypothetical protein
VTGVDPITAPPPHKTRAASTAGTSLSRYAPRGARRESLESRRPEFRDEEREAQCGWSEQDTREHLPNDARLAESSEAPTCQPREGEDRHELRQQQRRPQHRHCRRHQWCSFSTIREGRPL